MSGFSSGLGSIGRQVNESFSQARIAVADAYIDAFAARKTVNPVFVFLRRTSEQDEDDIVGQMRARIRNPGLINQGSAGLCGPASVLYQLALTRPIEYVQFACDLFDKGSALLDGMRVEPNRDLKWASKPAGIDAVDWLTMASIRNSENTVLFSYKSTSDEFSGLTTPGEMASWLRRTGYTDIKNETNTFLFSKGEPNARDASDLFGKGYKVFLLIHAQMLKFETEDLTSSVPNHWVCLSSKIEFPYWGVKFTIYSWGNPHYQVPQPRITAARPPSAGNANPQQPRAGHDFTLKMFLENYYGYVAARR